MAHRRLHVFQVCSGGCIACIVTGDVVTQEAPQVPAIQVGAPGFGSGDLLNPIHPSHPPIFDLTHNPHYYLLYFSHSVHRH